jgi:ATP adenylyltransferase
MTTRFDHLSDFIQNKMRMSHVYQPVMLSGLLNNNGSLSIVAIAKLLLSYDIAQIDYYENITKNMVGRVLTKNHKLTEKDGDTYRLHAFGELTLAETQTLIRMCQDKIDEYIEKRGDKIWNHRKKSSGYISGTTRYEVLKRAKSRCELCGISMHEKALEVDHIVPRSKGGVDDLTNLQALCYSCNAMKRDRDDEDFRQVVSSYDDREPACVFCAIPAGRMIDEDELFFIIRDMYPVTGLHTLLIPKRHTADYFGLHQPELNSLNRLLSKHRDLILAADAAVTGFNIGMNAGEDAGQTVHHCHIHLIPRRNGDSEDPRGGVRGVIPLRQKY